MATNVRLIINGILKVNKTMQLTRQLSQFKRFESNSNLKSHRKYLYIIGGGVATVIFANVLKESTKVHARSTILSLKHEEDTLVKLTPRERRFIKFASVEFDGQLYMTPQDFLSSVVEQEPRPRLKRNQLTLDHIKAIRDETPPLKKGSSKLFRNLRDKGIISYTEYLFLLSVLTKPRSGFHIAFNMFDTDGNQRVDKHEFLVIQKILGGAFREQDLDEKTRKFLLKLVSTKEQAKHLISPKSDSIIEDEEGLQRHHKVDTTLQLHFFGKKGNQDLNFENFKKFMDNLQTEVLELEFNEFAKGLQYISEIDFARILLRYTYLDADEYDVFLDRILDRFKYEKGVSFQEFRDFCCFLNNLEDFSIAMRMYTLADRPISKEEFSRAVKICTGFTLTTHIIDTVFAIFDEDGDGLLSYKEFIAFMKDRLHRGFKVSRGHVLEYNEDFNEYEVSDNPMFAVWRQRACRHLDHFIEHDVPS